MGKKYDYDFIVIGSGAAGSPAALMAAGAGLKVALVEAGKFGGSETHYDIPKSAALHASHLYFNSVLGAKFGLSSSNLRYNFPTVQNWQETAERRALATEKKEYDETGVKLYKGRASFVNEHEISIKNIGNITADKFLIATGSVPNYEGITGAETYAITPKEILKVARVPKATLVIGGGATGCEIAEYLSELGSQVLIADLSDRLLPRFDTEVGELIEYYFTKQLGIRVLTSAKIVEIRENANSKEVVYAKNGRENSVRVEAVVLATGSLPATDLGLENAGVQFGSQGIKTAKWLQTTQKHIFAAGDVIDVVNSSSEKAAHDAAIATANIINHTKSPTDYRGFMQIVDTFPKVASVGLSEDDCIKRSLKYKSTIVPLSMAASSNYEDFRSGFIKIIASCDGKILGASAVCPNSDLVLQEIALALRQNLSALDLASTPHPAFAWSELVHLAARRLAR